MSTAWVPGPVRLADIAELIRAPAAFTVPGDVLLGAVTSRQQPNVRTLGLAASSVALYWAGMALNDWADRHVDAVERPERPLPSGRVAPRTALGVATGLTLGSLALTHLAAGRRAVLRRALPLAATIWAYDLGLKSTRWGAPAMALARGLDVLHGTGSGAARGAAFPAAVIAVHTHAVTRLSRHEVDGCTGAQPHIALATTAALSLMACALPEPGVQGIAAGLEGARGHAPAHAGDSPFPAARTTMAALYAATAGPAQFRAVRRPGAARVRAAVGAGIHAFLPLQAALLARAGRPVLGSLLSAALPLATRSARKVSFT
ncbi:SCO3242 family prenyltransferase [Streptomyces sp. NPDC050549]|uniref:SCO3242 family prenyltransferase n=1 Tax=Streptomyces sp. NPDC050549 TaxID=3155406 RepID=UPI003445F27E